MGAILEYFKHDNVLNIGAYWKTIFAMLGAAISAISTYYADGTLTSGEIFQAIQMALAAGGFVYVAPANQT